MQGKVSMVVPCYNKVKHIGDMLDSVIAQVWDNIEVILVNDGSTDGTREVITEYEPKLRRRGYKVIVIDQENAGCCAAVHAGLLAMTGDYFCLVDSDDELYPEYVSKIASFLEENPDYDLAACQFSPVEYKDGTRIVLPPYEYRYTPEDGIEDYILYNAPTAVWIYIVRRPYLRKIKLIENFSTERNRSYEPLFAVPYLAYRGKLKYFSEPLYYFNLHANELSSQNSIASAREYVGDKKRQFERAIQRLDVPIEYQKRLLFFVEGACYRHTIDQSLPFREKEAKEFLEVEREYTLWIRKLFTPLTHIDDDVFESFLNINWEVATDIIVERSDYQQVYSKLQSADRIICYGALGRRAEIYYPILRVLCDTMPKTTLFWDANAMTDSALRDRQVLVPSFDSLTENDFIIVIPRSTAVLDFVCENCREATVIAYDEVCKYLLDMDYRNSREVEFS